jgi:hypothetical protein
LQKIEKTMDISVIKTLSQSERLQIMEALWDSLLYEKGDIDAPAWHGEIIKERRIMMSENEAKYISLKELKQKFT